MGILSFCCGGRSDKLQDEEEEGNECEQPLKLKPEADGGAPAEAPAEAKAPEPQGKKKSAKQRSSVLKKIGNSCCCGAGPRSAEARGHGPAAPVLAVAEDGPESGPCEPKALQAAAAAGRLGAKPELGGAWVLAAVEGDMDRFCADFGKGWVQRTVAQGMKYGVGTAAMLIIQEGDYVHIEKTMVTGAQAVQDLTVGKGECVLVDDLGEITGTSEWDGEGGLCVRGVLTAGGQSFSLRRHLRSTDELVDVITSPQGTTVQQVYRPGQ